MKVNQPAKLLLAFEFFLVSYLQLKTLSKWRQENYMKCGSYTSFRELCSELFWRLLPLCMIWEVVIYCCSLNALLQACNIFKIIGLLSQARVWRLDSQSCTTHFEFVVIYVLLTINGSIGGISSVCNNKGKQIHPWQKSTACNKLLFLPQTNQEGKSFNPVITQKQ